MTKRYLYVFIISTVLKCISLQSISNDIASVETSTAITIPPLSNSTVKDPGIDQNNAIIEPLQPLSPTVAITAASPTKPSPTLPVISSTIPTETKLLPTLLQQAAIDSFGALKPSEEESSSTTLSTTTVEVELKQPSVSRQEPKWPESCSERTPHKIQPIQDDLSLQRKCCPVGESFSNGNYTDPPTECVASDADFAMNPIAVTLYEGCIEDNETIVEMEVVAGNNCNRSVYYSEVLDDRMFVIQNGSLLVMDRNGTIGFKIYNDYCIDINVVTGKYDAIVCVSPPVEVHIGQGQTIIFTTFMIISIPCLFFVTFIHFAIDNLNHLHGLCIGSMSFCLGFGFLLHSISQLSTRAELKLQYAVQYFILAYYMWIFILCLNLVLFLWVYVLRYINLRKHHKTAHFIAYFIVAMVLPIFLVVYTKIKRIPGMPSYFQQAWSESIKSGQRYFIPPVSTILAICFVLLVLAFFGFRKLDEILNSRENVTYHLVENGNTQQQSFLPKIDRAFAEQVQLNARCLALLYTIVVFTWVLEVVTFYAPGAGDYLLFLEAMNTLQGVFILIIFVIIRKKRAVISSWWHDRGSHSISEGTELQSMKTKLDPEKNQDNEERS